MTSGAGLDPLIQVPVDLETDDGLAGPVTFRIVGWLALNRAGLAAVACNRGSVRLVAAWLPPLLGYRGAPASEGATGVGMTDPTAFGPLVVEPAHPLRESHGRRQVLDNLTERLVGLDAPVRAWPGHRPHLVLLKGDAAAVVPTRELARTAQVGQTVLVHPGHGELPVSLLRRLLTWVNTGRPGYPR